ncbi:MAG: hypothetical protein JWP12_682 [Bacteroidetes bacterium]|nr:hypothetical protein [Bacteroidota bacterium]
MSTKPKSVTCQLSQKEIPLQHAVKLDSISNTLLNKIKEKQPEIDVAGYVGTDALNQIREESIKEMLESDKGEISKLDAEVLENIKSNELLSLDLKDESNENESFGIRLADNIAEFGGSWKFIIIFGSFILVWIASNIYLLANKGFDPYPFILLNLILSCLAALQAPVIMMSQNRMEVKDRKRAENDYKINLKAELEIRHLHEKMDHLIMKQMQHLNEIQQIQIELLEEINNKK